MAIIAAADAREMRRLMPATLAWNGPIYIRLAKGHDPVVTADDGPFVIGKAVPARDGDDALILVTGVALQVGLAAADVLVRAGFEVCAKARAAGEVESSSSSPVN